MNQEIDVLSNLYEFNNPIKLNGLYFHSVECAYQYHKFFVWQTLYPNSINVDGFELLTPSEAIYMSQANKIPEDVLDIFMNQRDSLLVGLLYRKFVYNPELLEVLFESSISEDNDHLLYVQQQLKARYGNKN